MFGIATRIHFLRYHGRLLADDRVFTFRERFWHVASAGRNPNVNELLLKRLRSANGTEYFDIGGSKIFFRPGFPVADDREPLLGALTILRESFVDPPTFFCDEVQLRPGDVAFDLGGNVGTSALVFSREVGPEGRVFSFEPVFHEVLRRNMRENGIANVTVVPEGVSDRSGELEFAITERGIDSRIDPDGVGSIRKMIPVTTLDDFCAREAIERIDFIKMDIEGAEELALRGAGEVIRRFRPRWSIASYHTDRGFGGEPQHPKLVALLKEYGYELHEIPGHHIYAW
jgi:FkbM family methyltransferase